jgi:hypothetical protein
MGIQTIIDNATFLTIDKRKVAASTVSRSGHLKTADRGVNFYQFTVGMHDGLTYSTNRSVLEDLDTADIVTEANVSLNNNSNMQYLTNYQGDIATVQLNNITVRGHNSTDLYINCSGATGSGTLFKKGDFIQPKGNTSTYRYPYQVTADVTFSTGANVTVPVHRGVLTQTGVSLASGGLRVGNDVRFHIKSTNMPTYTVVPHDRISFTSDFEFMEVIT